jgi:hypothetical protein
MTNNKIDEFFDSLEDECIEKSYAYPLMILTTIVGMVIGYLLGTL